MQRTGYIHIPSKNGMAAFNIVFDAGSRHEILGKQGTMHLMEHLICKVINRKFNTILDRFMIDDNAYTSFSDVCFSMHGMDKYLTKNIKNEYLRTIIECLDELTEDDFEKEKNVVMQEWYEMGSNKNWVIYDNVLSKWFGMECPIGNINDISTFSMDDMRSIHQEYFTKPAKIVDISGERNIFLENIDYCSLNENLPDNCFKERNGMYLLPYFDNDESIVNIVSKKMVEISDVDCLAIGLEMLLSDFSSPFITRLRTETGLLYWIYYSVISCWRNGIMMFNCQVAKHNTERLCDEIRKLIGKAGELMTKDRYELIINQHKITSEMRELNPQNYMSSFNGITHLPIIVDISKVDYNNVIKTTLEYLNNSIVLIDNEMNI